MSWNIAAECVSGVILCIIMVYSRQGNPLPSLKNRVFQVCLLATFSSISTNILSTLMLEYYEVIPPVLTWVVTTLYFIATPFMGTIYFIYSLSFIYENDNRIWKIVTGGITPYLIYLFLVLLNPFTKSIFDVVEGVGYVQGDLIWITYAIFYVYCLLSLVIVQIKRRGMDGSNRRILTLFPILAVLVIVIQQFIPVYLLSGSAATCSLLIIYLYLQNKRISIDYLTGISNRQEFLKMLELKLKQQKQTPFVIVVLSLNGFKKINDKFGQQNGDLLLQKFSSFLKTVVKPTRLYRFSGDQFAILREGNKELEWTGLVKRLQERLTKPWQIQDYSCMITGSFGILQYPDCANSMEDIINGIEYAVGQAKLDKVNGCSYCTPEMLNQLRRKNDVAELLKEALHQQLFEVYFQPILSLDTREFVMAESLLRLNNTRLGTIYPSEFIPIAEETGLIVEITYQVLDTVCRFLKRLREQGRDVECITVNLSAVQFMETDLTQKLLGVMKKNDVPYSKIKIEVTESVLISNFTEVCAFIEEMRGYQIRFALDDFGTGYSNITSVLKLPFDTIKLDKSMVWDAVKSEKSAALVRYIALAFRELGISVLAEGVETQEQSQFIEDCGCDLIQGFLYAKPMPAAEAEKMLGRCVEKVEVLSSR